MPRISLLLVLVASASGLARAECPDTDSQALAWLQRMSHSLHEISYEGVVTFQRGEDLQVMQISHAVADGHEHESLTQLTGQGARVVRLAHPLECVHPGHELLRVAQDLQAGDCGIAAFYRLGVSPGERVAGRTTVHLSIRPRDMYRFGYLMALDKETGLLLKTQTMASGGRALERFQFAKLSIGQPLPTLVDDGSPAHQAAHPMPAAAGQSLAPAGRWQVGWLPRGFTATDHPEGGEDRRTYTDGLAVFSVFLEELAQTVKPGEGVVRNGSTTSYTRGMRIAGRSVLVTVVGEVPVNTARMVADAIQWAG
jgi:sigma-E factor negative regulatory protein RseB